MALENKGLIVTLCGTQFELGKKYRDVLLGTEGICTAGATYLSGGDQIQLAWLGDRGEVNQQWYDAQRIERADEPPF